MLRHGNGVACRGKPDWTLPGVPHLIDLAAEAKVFNF